MILVFFTFQNFFKLYVGVSPITILNGNFIAECVVWQPSKRITMIPDDTIARAILFNNLIFAKISEI